VTADHNISRAGTTANYLAFEMYRAAVQSRKSLLEEGSERASSDRLKVSTDQSEYPSGYCGRHLDNANSPMLCIRPSYSGGWYEW
jgi:hypothetical protein